MFCDLATECGHFPAGSPALSMPCGLWSWAELAVNPNSASVSITYPSLSFSLATHKMGTIMAPISQGCLED